VHTTAAETLIAEKASSPAPIAAPISFLFSDVILLLRFLVFLPPENWHTLFWFPPPNGRRGLFVALTSYPTDYFRAEYADALQHAAAEHNHAEHN
jgi:hypothetical protein